MQWIDDLLQQANAAIAADNERRELRDRVEQLRRTVPYVHPAGGATIDLWYREMLDAADHGDDETIAKLARLIHEKIELEQKWHEESLRGSPSKA